MGKALQYGLPLAFILVTAFSYWPGLTGPFIFDDYANLDKLGSFNGVRNFETFTLYITNGIAGPTGRPLSLLSFLVNGTNWPTDPYPFKFTNVIIHCSTGTLLWFLCRQLLISHNFNIKHANIAALIAASFWLLHPFFVSTVLYVVQRMAMLSAFFSLAGLWLYAKGRLLAIDSTFNRKAYLYMSLGVGPGTMLAVLSKENGILLPFLAACVEYCVFNHPNSLTKPINRYWAWLFLWLPSLAIFYYLFHSINPDTFTQPFGGRSFTLPERLLTESRIVTGYLYNLAIPKMSYPGLMNENIQLSRDFFHPIETLYSVGFIAFLITFAYKIQKCLPFLALAILFFFAGHILESTTLNLELYFEHRNYLPAVFLFLPVGQLFVTQQNSLARGFIVFLLAICSLFTHQLSRLWGDELALTLSWAKQNPTSSRAQEVAAMALEFKGNNLAALQLLDNAKTKIPNSLDLYWHWFILKCQLTEVTSQDLSGMVQASRQLTFDAHHYNILQATVEYLIKPECKGSSAQFALTMLDTLLTNPNIATKDPRLLFQPHHLKGYVLSETHRPKEALKEYKIVLDMTQNIEHGLVQVSILASKNYFQEALEHLEDVEKILARQPQSSPGIWQTKLDYAQEIKRIKSNLLTDIQKTAINSQHIN